ncbi:UDP-N-acetylmuramate--L-alanine ligase, partial [Lachnotalea glycerini]
MSCSISSARLRRYSFACSSGEFFASFLSLLITSCLSAHSLIKIFKTSDLNCSVITYGQSACNTYSAANIEFDAFAHPSFDLVKENAITEHITLNVPGIHNVYNSLAAIAVADNLLIEPDMIKKGIMAYSGTDRRFEYKGEIGGVTIIDDYAHHPTEIAATLNAAKNYPHKTTWCVFQPHTYTRTKAFLGDFAKALSLADKIVLADIYAARETDTLGISSET